jgi:hypothetical protein
MDPAAIATAVVAFLAPYLAEGGKAVAKKVGEALVAALERRFKGQPAAEEAVHDLKATPQDADVQAALRHQLKKALAADPEFLAELARLLAELEPEAPAAGYHAEVRGSGAIAQGTGAAAAGAGGMAISGGVTVTGQGNVVGSGSRSSVRIEGEKKE